MNESPTIGLYGIKGVYNYGCEAIVRGTEIILRETWPDVTIKYASPRPKDDKKRLIGSNVEIVPRKPCPPLSFSRLNRMLSTTTGLYYDNLYRENLNWLEDCDMVFSIGGDLYTLPPNYIESKIKPYFNYLIHFGDQVQKRGKNFVIWGASIGPFEKGLKAKKAFINHFKNVDLITSREPKTTSYLKSLGISENIVNCADPAFVVPSININPISRGKLCIGINLSPLSLEFAFGEDNPNKMTEYYADLISSLIKDLDAHIILIPHVVCDFDIKDDDLRYLKTIHEKLPEDIKNQVEIIDGDIGFIETKNYLAVCDIVIASRMHCAINSLSLGIPTILIAYSQKAKGMALFVYGNDKWMIPLKDVNKVTLTKLVRLMLLEKEYINSFLEKKVKLIKKEAYDPGMSLNNIYHDKIKH